MSVIPIEQASFEPDSELRMVLAVRPYIPKTTSPPPSVADGIDAGWIKLHGVLEKEEFVVSGSCGENKTTLMNKTHPVLLCCAGFGG